MKKIIFAVVVLFFLFRIAGAEKIAELPEVADAAAVTTDGSVLYIMEESRIHLYSLEPFRLVKSFGVRGEGPGEFNSMPYLTIGRDSLLIQTMGKIMTYTKTGEFLEQTKLPFVYFYWYAPLLPVGDHFVGFPVTREEDSMDFVQTARIYTPEWEQLKDFFKGTHPLIPLPPRRDGKQVKVNWPLIPDCVGLAVSGDKIIVGDTRRGFCLGVFDQRGNKLYEIRKEDPKLKISKEFKQATWAEMKETQLWERTRGHWNYIMRDYFPAFTAFKVKEDKIFLTSYEQKNGRYKVIVLDLKGQLLDEAFVFPFEPATRRLMPYGLYDFASTEKGSVFYYLVLDEEKMVYSLHRLHVSS
jgi:hypothetical protein